MTDESRDEAENGIPPEPPATPPEPGRPGADRRNFLRQLSGDAVVTAGRMAGLSTLVTRSISAAGASVARDLETLGGAGGPGTPVTAPTPNHEPPSVAPAEAVASAEAVAQAAAEPAAAATETAPDASAAAVARLTADQLDLLASTTSGRLAVNDPAGAPHLTTTALTWDGASFAIPSQLFGARSGHIERDPRVTLLLEDQSTGAWVTVTGVASLEDPHPADDRVTIRVRPTRFVWRPPTRPAPATS